MGYFSRPEEILEHLRNLFEAQKELLGFNYIAIADEELLPEFPALQITSESLQREIHTTAKFNHVFTFALWIYHANLMVGAATRSIEDLELTTKVTNFLHQRRTLSDSDGKPQIIFGYVTGEFGGLARIIPESPAVITTRITWEAQTQVNFDSA
jgi:hypothetical protein